MKKFIIQRFDRLWWYVGLTEPFQKLGCKMGGPVGSLYTTEAEAEEWLRELEAGIGEAREKKLRIWREPGYENRGPKVVQVDCPHCMGTGRVTYE